MSMEGGAHTEQLCSTATRVVMPRPTDALEIILKLAGESCNINCHYCFEKRKPYDRATVLQPETLRQFLGGLGERPLMIGLHGGEPLLIGRSRMAKLLAELRRHPAPIELKLQTNGLLLNQSWIEFFRDEWPDLTIGISLDGDARGNAHRVDYDDRPTYERVLAALDLLTDAGKHVGVICVVNRQLLGRAREIIGAFSKIGCLRAVNFAPCLDFAVRSKQYKRRSGATMRVLNPPDAGIPGWATTPDEYAEFLIDAFAAWRDSGAYQRFTIEPFVSVIRVLAGKSPGICHFSENKCAFVLTLYPDGRVGGCDELDMPAAYLGRTTELIAGVDLVGMTTNPRLLTDLDRVLARCEGCEYQATCGGGCLATRLRYEGTPLSEEYCAYRMKVIDHIARAIGRPAPGGSAEVVA